MGRWVECSGCAGTGKAVRIVEDEPLSLEQCTTCEGQGRLWLVEWTDSATFDTMDELIADLDKPDK